MEKKINYLSRSFSDIKDELIKFGKIYYPELSDSFNDASVMSWLVDMVSAVGDNLSYYTDRAYQSTNINSADTKQALINIARANGIKVPGPKASACEVEISCTLPIDVNDVSSPAWKFAPIVKKGTVVGNGSQTFEIDEDVDFAEQFNHEGFSNRKYKPNRNSNGIITSYTVSKTAVALGGTTRIFKKVLTHNDVHPFMEIVLPEQNIMNIESVIFKETSNFNEDPKQFEYYVDEEQFRVSDESIYTYRFFEVDALTDQYRFGTKFNGDENTHTVKDEEKCESYEDVTEGKGKVPTRTTRYYKGEWKPITQKFITETTANGFTKLIFGSGVASDETPNDLTPYGKYRLSKIINNDMLGVLPRMGWTMFVAYRVGGGVTSNLAKGAVNSLMSASYKFKNEGDRELTPNVKSSIISSFKVTNLSTSVAGKDAPSNVELKNIIKYTKQAQDRCVTINDYKSRISYLPPKYGAPYRYNVIEDNNKIMVYTLGLTSDKKLDKSLPNIMVDNMMNYLEGYKSLGDFIVVNSGKVYHIAVEADLFVDKNYSVAEVVKDVISKIKSYFDIDNREMGEDIFVGDLEKEITSIDGVLSIIDLKIYNIYGGTYSQDVSTLPRYVDRASGCDQQMETFIPIQDDGARSFRIGLDAIDGVLYNNPNSMFEIKEDTDINIRVKLK